MSSISRWLTSALEKGLSFQRAALLVGARQSGKTTLVREQCPVSAQYVTMDNEASLLAAREDPHFFLNQYAVSGMVDLKALRKQLYKASVCMLALIFLTLL